MCVWKMRLQRTKSAIISWVGSYTHVLWRIHDNNTDNSVCFVLFRIHIAFIFVFTLTSTLASIQFQTFCELSCRSFSPLVHTITITLYMYFIRMVFTFLNRGARWLSGRVSDSGARGRGFETYRRRVVSLSKTRYSPKVLVNYPGSGGSVPTWLKNCWLGR